MLFTHLAIPVMTRLRQPERQVLDTLVDAGVARSRSDALAWSVKLVGEHAEEWLTKLRDAMSEVDELRDAGPGPLASRRESAFSPLPPGVSCKETVLGELDAEHLPVGAPPCQQFGVGALLDNPPGVHDHDQIGIADRRKAVRDDETRSVPA